MLKQIIVLLLLLPLVSIAQGWLPMGGRSNSMANATVALSDAWAFHHNPGALAEVKQQTFGVSYENRFLLKELQSQGFVYVQPLKTGVFSVGAQLTGFNLYRTQRIGAGYSLQLSEKFSAGVQLNYQGIKLPDNYGSRNTVTAELGFLAKLTENWKIGFSIFNLGRVKLADYKDERFSTLMRLGTSYSFSKKVLVTAEVEKNVNFPLRVKAGMDYQLLDNFYFRAGLATKPIELSFGFGYKFKQFQCDIGSSYHQVLGWSPHISFTYSRK